MADAPARTWHQALVYAVTGERRPELGTQVTPDLDAVVEAVQTVARAGSHGAHAVPADLREGIGPAQLAALLTELRSRLGRAGRPVLADRAPDADERRLLADVPPHHGA